MMTPNELPAVQWVDISVPRLNDNNPRTIKDPKFEKLINSIKEFPEMMLYRPLVLNADFIILGGNMRYRAAREAGLTKVPVLIASSFTEAQQFEFIIKDNVGFGDWDFEDLANNWTELPLEDWGLELPVPIADAPDAGGETKEKKFKLEVVATTESEQDQIYERLREAGYDVKKK